MTASALRDVHVVAPQADSDDGLLHPRRAFAVGAVLAAMATVVIDAGISNVALPTIARALQVAPARAILVVTAYQAALLMALLPCAAFGERFGYRRVFGFGVVIFSAGSLGCALSPSLPWLLAARFIEGVGGGAVLALGMALLRAAVSDRRLGAAIGWNALTVALSAAAGPAIGAVALSYLAWPWLYAMNLPLGVGVMLALRAAPRVAGRGGPLDAFSIGLNCAVLGFVVMGAEIAPTAPAPAIMLFALSAIAGVVLIRREKPKAKPLVPLDLLGHRSFRISIVASVCCFTGQAAGLLALPFYLQHGLGQSSMTTGLYMTVWPLSVAATALAHRVVARASTSLLCVVGAAVLSLGLAALALWPLQGAPLLLIPFSAICGVGFGLFQVANNRNMFLSAPRDRSGAAGAMQGVARLSGQTAGAVLVTLLFALVPLQTADRIAIGIGATLTLVASLVSVLRSEVAPSALGENHNLPA